MKKLGLIGFPLTHSFSQKYFTQKFAELGLENDWQYNLYPIENINELPQLLTAEPALIGLNVTIPHKISILKFLNEIDAEAEAVGAVNCIKISIYKDAEKWLKGYNTDVYGFRESLKPLLKQHHKRALVLGSGGASKAVQFVLHELGIDFLVVSRNADHNQLAYSSLDGMVLQAHPLIINTTPLGMYPDVSAAPEIPYKHLTKNHLLYDLVYNPAETLFLQKGKEAGAHIKGGLQMLHLQAEKAWQIWNS